MKNGKIRIGVVGTGRGRTFMDPPDCTGLELAAVCDRREDKLEFVRRHYGRDGKPDYDLIVYVASWPQQRIDAWDALLKARAIENVCFVAGVNRAGKDPGNLYSGHTSLYGPRGELLSICKEGRIDIIEFELKHALLDQFRDSFPALRDADNQ